MRSRVVRMIETTGVMRRLPDRAAGRASEPERLVAARRREGPGPVLTVAEQHLAIQHELGTGENQVEVVRCHPLDVLLCEARAEAEVEAEAVLLVLVVEAEDLPRDCRVRSEAELVHVRRVLVPEQAVLEVALETRIR